MECTRCLYLSWVELEKEFVLSFSVSEEISEYENRESLVDHVKGSKNRLGEFPGD